MKYLLLLLGLIGCAPHAATASKQNGIDTGMEYAVVLETAEGSAYCAGVAIGSATILTASHCVADADPITDEYASPIGKQVQVETYTGDVATAVVVAWDPGKDLARLAWTGANALTYTSVGKTWYVSEPINIVGSPAHVKWAYMRGYISHLHKHASPINGADMNMMQVQAPVWYGNSGGGVFDDNGKLLGIVSMRSTVPDVGLVVAPDEIAAFLTVK